MAAGGLVGKGRDISLAALRRHDPYINSIVDVASQVALYTFGHRANEWEKTDVEGTLFVYTRSASPKHGFTIMNRLSMENRTEPITKDLDFQLQDPFLLYRNARLSIYGIWFYDKEECQRIAELMKNLTQYEQLKAHQGAGAGMSPMILNSGEGKEVDILRMLTKAKDEYTKVLDPEPQHLSLTALFGKQGKATCQETVEPPQTLHHQQQPEKLPIRHGVVRSLSYEEPRKQSPPLEKQLCPAIQKLMVRNADLHPVSELPEHRPCENGNTHSSGEVFTRPVQPGSPHMIGTSHGVRSASKAQNLLEKLQSTPGAVNKYDPSARASASSAAPNCSRTLRAATLVAPVKGLAQPQLVYFNGSLPPQALGHQAHGKEQSTLTRQMLPLSGNQTSSSGVISPQELLKKLQTVQQEQQLHASNRPALAAKFPVGTQSCRTGKPLESWINKTSGPEKPTPLFQVISPQHIPATVAPSLLMSPRAFTQSTSAPPKERESGLLPLGGQELPVASTSLLLPLQSPEPSWITSSPLTKLQLQEALLYLIQNDDTFLNVIYEAYLFSMTQAAMKKTV
ncbi:PREDICTED: mRNA-decapping enzyme 1B isoform X2 [Galeopterus variegatus]|uniref:5'-(N(7)-methylguanosine 5'-triphospho)-[mRNA] hydrolase n=1 Tax=Galeopterus variegatus TaxID=482537 RepID=A0ABM0QC45_GALVR|nr:PREDICTED: mRNA-decapping enzyme 1B isoform X2 [Galeopterus variegatus]